MAVTKTVLKAAENETVVKVQGTAAAATIALATDILASTQVVDGATQKVNIAGISWTGAANSQIQITRNSVVIATLIGETAAQFDFTGQGMVSDTTENTKDIVVTISGAQAECWIRLKKVSGYKSKVEDGLYGSYDDPTRVGASTTKPGSPDYTPA